MSAAATAERVEAFLGQAVRGAGREGTRLALDLVDGGLPCDQVIVGLLAEAQREVGERWLRNEWTVADEHLATGVAQKALDAVADAVEPVAADGVVVVACAEGDWHSLPAQMFAELLRARGFAVAFLGASTPVDHVEELLVRLHPVALAVSCNVPLFFGGVTRLAEMAHRHGVPVIAGGRALGRDDSRAIRLGADAWGAGIDDAEPILRAWRDQPPVVSTSAGTPDPTIEHLRGSAATIADQAFASLAAAFPVMTEYDERQLARTKEDLLFIVQFVAAARVVDDPSVLTEFLGWLRTLLAARGVPAAAVTAALAALAPLLGRADAAAEALARSAAASLTN